MGNVSDVRIAQARNLGVRQGGQASATHDHGAGGGQKQSGDQIQKGALSAAASAEDADKVPGLRGQIYILHRGKGPVAELIYFTEFLNLQQHSLALPQHKIGFQPADFNRGIGGGKGADQTGYQQTDQQQPARRARSRLKVGQPQAVADIDAEGEHDGSGQRGAQGSPGGADKKGFGEDGAGNL
ncbi:hypothetical protein SDC9_153259 [bioreactor metagenome]|uniref:Uncharacterized protein n=1 Tax=bioreactor metagenome TaxID=1076179 RepID=A0A645EVF9_9ZZZZ